MQRYEKGVPDWGTPMRKLNKKVNYYDNMGLLAVVLIFDVRCAYPQRVLHVKHSL